MFIFFDLLYFSYADDKSFLVHFQKSGKWSDREVLEFKHDFSSSIQEFTACHWEKLDYFSRETNTIWSYSEVTNETDSRLKGLNAAIESNNSTGGRDARFVIWIDGWTATSIVMSYRCF